jgi:hypothetical protein
MSGDASDCTLCLGVGESPMHLALLCPHEGMASFRVGLVIAAGSLLGSVLALGGALRRLVGIGPGELAAHVAQQQASQAASLHGQLSAAEWRSPGGRFVLWRLLAVLPWPARMIPSTLSGKAWKLARLLGATFDGVNVAPTRLRPLADVWAGWAGAQNRRLAEAWWRAVTEKMAALDNDAAGNSAEARDRCLAAYPRGCMAHLSVRDAHLDDSKRWKDKVNGQCDICSHDVAVDGRAACCRTCNIVWCRGCLGLSPGLWALLQSADGPWEWLCPQCTDMWLRRTASGDAAAGAALAAAAALAEQPLQMPPRKPALGFHMRRMLDACSDEQAFMASARGAAAPSAPLLAIFAATKVGAEQAGPLCHVAGVSLLPQPAVKLRP